MTIISNLRKIKDEIPADVEIIVVTKTKTIEDILPLYSAGQRNFGENKVQELIGKKPMLPQDIQWHFIGHLQSNKVKLIAPFVHLIQSIDSLKLLKEVNREGIRHKRIINCLLQFHIASEETKFGLDLSEAQEILDSDEYNSMTNISINGIMGMATFTKDKNLIRSEFRDLRTCFDILRNDYFSKQEDFREISMGMSSDYQIAIEEGSTMIRIGSAIFQPLV